MVCEIYSRLSVRITKSSDIGESKMKKTALKWISLILVVALALFSLVGCVDRQKPDDAASLPDQSEDSDDAADSNENADVMFFYINGNKVEVTLADNSSVTALKELLSTGDLTYTAIDYGGFEKVGNIGRELPTNDTQIRTESGDVALYQGNQIVIFYGSNSWSYTTIGRINGYSVSQLRSLLFGDRIQITMSLK